QSIVRHVRHIPNGLSWWSAAATRRAAFRSAGRSKRDARRNAALLAGSLYLFARAAGLARGAAVLGAILGPVTTMSVFRHGPLSDGVFVLSSYLVYFSAFSTLALALFWTIDGKWVARTVALAAGMTLAM